MNKKELRRLFLAKRESLTNAEYLELNQLICTRFFESINLSRVKVLHSFLPMIRRKEVDTMIIIDRLQKDFKNIKIAIPRISEDKTLEHFFYKGQQQLMINSWGIQEPKSGEKVESTAIDLVLVPLLAYDENGHRVGYGKGFYDKFLATCRPDCQKVGLSMFGPTDSIDDVGATDVRLDGVVTPKSIFDFC